MEPRGQARRATRRTAVAALRGGGVSIAVAVLVVAAALVVGAPFSAPPAAAELGGQRLHVTAVVVGAQPEGTSLDVSLSCTAPLLFPPAPMHFYGPGDQDINAQGMDRCTIVAPTPPGALNLSFRCKADGQATCLSTTSARADGQYLVTFTVTATYPSTPVPSTQPSVPGVTTSVPGGAPASGGPGDPSVASTVPGGAPASTLPGGAPAPSSSTGAAGPTAPGATGAAGAGPDAATGGPAGSTPAGGPAAGTGPSGDAGAGSAAAAAGTASAASTSAATGPAPIVVVLVVLLVLACVAGGAAGGVALRRRLQPAGPDVSGASERSGGRGSAGEPDEGAPSAAPPEDPVGAA